MGDSKRSVKFQEPLLHDEDKAYVAAGDVVLSSSNKNLQIPMKEEGVHLLGESPEEVNKYV